MNLLLAALCFAGAVYLVSAGRFFLLDRWTRGMGTLFSGLSLYMLAGGAFALGAFAGAVALEWMRGTLPMPGAEEVRPHPAYKGRIIVRYWFLVIPAFLLVTGAFLLADRVPQGVVGVRLPGFSSSAPMQVMGRVRCTTPSDGLVLAGVRPARVSLAPG